MLTLGFPFESQAITSADVIIQPWQMRSSFICTDQGSVNITQGFSRGGLHGGKCQLLPVPQSAPQFEKRRRRRRRGGVCFVLQSSVEFFF